MSERSAEDVVGELFRRQQARDDTLLDDLVAPEMVNHAAGPQGREGLRQILRTIDQDLGPVSLEPDRAATGSGAGAVADRPSRSRPAPPLDRA